MSKSAPFVFVSKTCPPSGLNRLKEKCKVVMHDSEVPISLENYKKCVVGADALFVHPPAPVNKEILDLAGLAAVRSGEWGTKWENALWLAGKDINDSVIGIVGLGRIGLETAKRLKAFEPSKILYSGHTQKPSAIEKTIDAEFVSFDKLLQESDFVIATCSINEENKGLFNRAVFKKMKSSAIFINVTRGVLVNQDDLYDALVAKEILAAGLDVTSPEPLPKDHKLLSLPNCVVTPHLGSASVKTRNAMCDLTVDNILAGLNGENLPSSALD